MLCTAAPLSGTSGTPVDVIGVFESLAFSLKREFASTKGAADPAYTSRATHWGEGSVTLTGFSRGTASKLAAIFAAGSHAIFQLTEIATGDSWQFMCTCKDFAKAIGESPTKDTITFGQEGVPFYAPAGGVVSAIPLEV